MNVFRMAVMKAVAAQVACMNAMQDSLFDACAFRVAQKMLGKTRARDAMPQARRMRLGRMMEIQAKCREFGHFGAVGKE